MPRYGRDLFDYIYKEKVYLSAVSIFNMGQKLLDIFELIHNSGYVYNDLKLENIVIDINEKLPRQSQNPNDNIFKNIRLSLIDFGLAS